jgi:hypothetical protein
MRAVRVDGTAGHMAPEQLAARAPPHASSRVRRHSARGSSSCATMRSPVRWNSSAVGYSTSKDWPTIWSRWHRTWPAVRGCSRSSAGGATAPARPAPGRRRCGSRAPASPSPTARAGRRWWWRARPGRRRRVHLDLAEDQVAAHAQHPACDLGVRGRARHALHEAGLQLHRGHRLEFAQLAHHRQHHRGVGRGHHGLAAQHAAAVHQRGRHGQVQHLARRAWCTVSPAPAPRVPPRRVTTRAAAARSALTVLVHPALPGPAGLFAGFYDRAERARP